LLLLLPALGEAVQSLQPFLLKVCLFPIGIVALTYLSFPVLFLLGESSWERSDYVLDRFNLPWSDKPDNPKTDADKLVKGGKEIAEYTLDRRRYPKLPKSAEGDEPEWVKELPRRQREPGVILFRKPYKQEVLLLFLIGETPTAGIYKTAFINALKQIDTMCVAGRQRLCQSVPVLAPTFSGSVDALSSTIQQWNARLKNYPGWSFNVHSGSATAIDKAQFLKDIQRNTKFSATIAPDAAALDCVLKVLEVKPQDKIVLLSEAGTGYGAQIVEATRRQNKEPASGGPCPKRSERSITSLSYPVHISQLRKAAEKVRGSDKEAAKEAPRIRPRNLRLSLEEGDDPKDILPPFSKYETFSTELVLSNILTTISRERIGYVGLFSTDIRDQIFLATEIRRHAPNVVLFTVGADLIYLHSDVNLDFQGMLVASSYPLFSKNQLWTYPFRAISTACSSPTILPRACTTPRSHCWAARSLTRCWNTATRSDEKARNPNPASGFRRSARTNSGRSRISPRPTKTTSIFTSPSGALMRLPGRIGTRQSTTLTEPFTFW